MGRSKDIKELRNKCRRISEQIRNETRETVGGQTDLSTPSRLLLLGKPGAGKSSFVTSICNICEGKINRQRQAEIYRRQDMLVTETYCELLNISLCIGRRSKQTSAPVLPDTFNAPLTNVVWIRSIMEILETDDDEDATLKELFKDAQQKGIPGFVVLTKIDKLKRKSRTGFPRQKDFQEKAASDACITTDRVFLIQNYTKEKSLHTKLDESILLALQFILLNTKTKSDPQVERFSWYSYESSDSSRPTRCDSIQTRDSGILFDSISSDVEPQSNQFSTNSPAVGDMGPAAIGAVRKHSEEMMPEQRVISNLLKEKPAEQEAIPKLSKERFKQLATPKLSKENLAEQGAIRKLSKEMLVGQGAIPKLSNEMLFRQGAIPKLSKEMLFRQGAIPKLSKEMLFRQGAIPKLSKNMLVGQIAIPNFFNEKIARTKFSEEMVSVQPSSRMELIQAHVNNQLGSDRHLRLVKYVYKKETIYKDLADVIFNWSSTPSDINIWLSSTLSVDFGLPFEDPGPTSIVVQAFILTIKKPPVLLTIFEEKYETCESEVMTYTVNTGRLLSSALLNHCRCNFAIVPCVVGRRNVVHVQEAISKQTEKYKKYHDDWIDLDIHVYSVLLQATTSVAHSVPVIPELNFIQAKSAEKVPLGELRHSVMSLLIEELSCNKDQCGVKHVTYPRDQGHQMALTVLEASRRLSFSTGVVIFTPYPPMVSYAESLKEKAWERTGVKLKLEVISPLPRKRPEHLSVISNIYIIFGSDSYPSRPPGVRVLCFSEQSNDCEDTFL